MTTPIVQEVISAYPQSKIDLFVKGTVAPEIFKNYSNIHQIIQLPKKPARAFWQYMTAWLSVSKTTYDLVINIARNSASGRLATQFANGRYKIFGDNLEGIDNAMGYQHLAKNPIYQFRRFLMGVSSMVDIPVPQLDLKLSSGEVKAGSEKLRKLVSNTRQTICLFTYATGDKRYSESWWQAFFKRLKFEFPNFNIIEILPIENVSRLSFIAPTFYSKDIREIGSVIANTRVFIGADSGMMHLANSVQTPTVGLFSVTDEKLYAPYGNHSRGINTGRSTTDDCVKIVRDILAKETGNDAKETVTKIESGNVALDVELK